MSKYDAGLRKREWKVERKILFIDKLREHFVSFLVVMDSREHGLLKPWSAFIELLLQCSILLLNLVCFDLQAVEEGPELIILLYKGLADLVMRGRWCFRRQYQWLMHHRLLWDQNRLLRLEKAVSCPKTEGHRLWLAEKALESLIFAKIKIPWHL